MKSQGPRSLPLCPHVSRGRDQPCTMIPHPLKRKKWSGDLAGTRVGVSLPEGTREGLHLALRIPLYAYVNPRGQRRRNLRRRGAGSESLKVPFLFTRERDTSGASNRCRDIRTFRRNDRIRENVPTNPERVLARDSSRLRDSCSRPEMQQQRSATRGIRVRQRDSQDCIAMGILRHASGKVCDAMFLRAFTS